MEYMPHFTVGNMKRTLDVVSATGEKIVALWTDEWVFFFGCVLSPNESKLILIGG